MATYKKGESDPYVRYARPRGLMKTCRDCDERKPLEAFPLASERVAGRASYCRECVRVRSRASYRRRRQAAGRSVREPRIVPDGKKWCSDCRQVKALEEFCRNKNHPTGRATCCKVCHNARCREVRDRLYGGGREYHLRARYGIGQAQVDKMLAEQGGLCLGCEKPGPEHVDHDHATGVVRGMLCFNCNQVLGNVRDNREVLDRLDRYLLVRQPSALRRCSERRPAAGLTIEISIEHAACA